VEKPFISNRQYVLLSSPLKNRQCYLNKLFPEKLLKVTAVAVGQFSSPRSSAETKLWEKKELLFSPANCHSYEVLPFSSASWLMRSLLVFHLLSSAKTSISMPTAELKAPVP